jgi:glycosyltransferase involved in cell wall biosynthesis
MSAGAALGIERRIAVETRPARLRVLHILEATSAGAARFVADVLLNHDLDRFDVSFAYSLIRSDRRFLSDLEKIQRRGVHTTEISMTRQVHPRDDLKSLRGLYRLMRQSRFDIVHSHSSKAGFLGRLASKMARRKAVTLYSPHAIAIAVNPIYKPIEKFAGFFTDGLMAVSRSEKEQLLSYNLVPADKIHFVTAAVDVQAYRDPSLPQGVRERLGIPATALLVGSAGRLADQKDPFMFLRVAEIVCQCDRDVHFVWAGDGELRAKVLEKSRLLGLEKRVHFPGYYPDLRPLLASLDIFALTSRYESFGYVTCEAMALGKPVVATNVAGSRELVADGRTGFLSEAGDAEGFAAKVLTLAGDSGLAARFGAAGRERVEQHFDLPRMVEDIEELYLRLCRG